MASERHPPPPDLDDKARRLWRKTRDWLVGKELWDDIDITALDRYVRAVTMSRHALEALIASEGLGPDGSLNLTTKGSQGQLVQHPNVKTYREAARDASDFAKQLGITLEARRRNGDDEDDPDDPFAEVA